MKLFPRISAAIHEIYSPKRVNAIAELMELIPGMSFDLTTNDVDGKPWDFNIEEKRTKAEGLVREKKALLVIGSPMCSAFSQIQNLNFSKMSPNEVKRVIDYGTTHLAFCAKLYQIQMDNRLYFSHEHPHAATSWENKGIKRLLEQEGVTRIKSHICAFGMESEDKLGKGFAKKPTGFMTNVPELAKRLELCCPGGHRHVIIRGGKSRRTEVYPNELCREIIIGLKDQMYKDGRLEAGCLGSLCPIHEDGTDYQEYKNCRFWDDFPGAPLRKEGVIRARKDELEQFRKHTVYLKRP